VCGSGSAFFPEKELPVRLRNGQNPRFAALARLRLRRFGLQRLALTIEDREQRRRRCWRQNPWILLVRGWRGTRDTWCGSSTTRLCTRGGKRGRTWGSNAAFRYPQTRTNTPRIPSLLFRSCGS